MTSRTSRDFENFCALADLSKHLVTSIQFNSKTLFKDGDPVNLHLSSLGPSKHVNNTTIFHTYIQNKLTQVHQTNTGKHNLHFHTKTYP